MAAPMPAVGWPVRCAGTPRSRAASTWRKLRPMPRCAPTNEPFGRHQGQVEVREPLGIDPPVIQQDIA